MKHLGTKKNPKYTQLYNQSLTIINSKARIVYPSVTGEYVYNFWQDDQHVRGIWRRVLKTNYDKGATQWETLLDVDALANKEGKKWVFHGATPLYPGNGLYLISSSNGGGDANEIREFDVRTQQFVPNGITFPEAKSNIQYVDENTLLVATDFGPGTLTTSGYPKNVKLWKRGTPLSEAKVLLEGDPTDVFNSGSVYRDNDKSYIIINKSLSFYTRKLYWYSNQELRAIPLPEDATLEGIKFGKALVQLKSDWEINQKIYTQGSLLAIDFEGLMQGNFAIDVLFKPTAVESLESVVTTKKWVVINVLNNVKSEVFLLGKGKDKWYQTKVSAPVS